MHQLRKSTPRHVKKEYESGNINDLLARYREMDRKKYGGSFQPSFSYAEFIHGAFLFGALMFLAIMFLVVIARGLTYLN